MVASLPDVIQREISAQVKQTLGHTSEQSRIEAAVAESLGVIHIRQQIAEKEQEIEQIEKKMADMPTILIKDVLKRPKEQLIDLFVREEALVSRATKAVKEQIREEKIQEARAEAAEKLNAALRAYRTLEMCLSDAIYLDREMRRKLGAGVFAHQIDHGLITRCTGSLTERDGLWTLSAN